MHQHQRFARALLVKTSSKHAAAARSKVACSWGIKATQVGHQVVSAGALSFSFSYAGEQGGRAEDDQERIVESWVGVLGRCVEHRSGR